MPPCIVALDAATFLAMFAFFALGENASEEYPRAPSARGYFFPYAQIGLFFPGNFM